MAFVEAARIADLPPGSVKGMTVAGKHILLANRDGVVYAIGRRCTHLGGDLAQGKLEGTAVVCPRHGARFDLATGKAMAGPKIGPLKLPTKDQVAYAVKVEGDRILVDIRE